MTAALDWKQGNIPCVLMCVVWSLMLAIAHYSSPLNYCHLVDDSSSGIMVLLQLCYTTCVCVCVCVCAQSNMNA